jgi:hypothetical protein
VRDAAAAVGRTTTSPLRTGEPITDVRLLAGSLLAGYPGTVASPVRIGDPGAVALLQVGDRVDILAADPQGQTPPQLVAARAPVIALPQPGPADQMAQPGMTSGGLIVLAVPESTAADLAGAAVARYLSLVIDR